MENGNSPEIPESPEFTDGPAFVDHPVIFYVDRLPLRIENNATDPQERLRNYYSILAATYYLPLAFIFNSRLNAAGRVSSVYVDFGNLGCCRINPQHAAFDPINLERFNFMLDSYTELGVVLDANGVEIWRRVDPEIHTILAGFPANTHVIGCISGEGFPNAPNYLPYIQAFPELPLAFVIGMTNFPEERIDIIVKVAEFPLPVENIALRICTALEQKWGIN